MLVIETVNELKKSLIDQKRAGNTIGFSPTMGALHKGHLSLLEKSKSINDIQVYSIFVNPTQFNQKEDLVKYPRSLESDLELLKNNGCDIAFTPSAEEIYPEDFQRIRIDLKGLDDRMEGSRRPGHFEGVVHVVKRLLDIVKPDQLYMGQKDFQQLTIIRYMIEYFKMDVELVVCPTLRESDGLAMSSRNVLIKPEIRVRASVIYKTLKAIPDWLKYIPVNYTIDKAMNALDIADFSPEYFEIVDANTLLPVEDFEEAESLVACTAVWAGAVRLIDNMIYKQTP